MYIQTIPNRTSPPVILLREGFRENGKVAKRTPDPERFAHLLGSSWLRCPWIIFAVSMPALFGTLRAWVDWRARITALPARLRVCWPVLRGRWWHCE